PIRSRSVAERRAPATPDPPLCSLGLRPGPETTAEQNSRYVPMPRSLPKIAIWCFDTGGNLACPSGLGLLAAAAESDCRLAIWLAPVRLIMGSAGCATERPWLPYGGLLPAAGVLGLAAVPGRVEPVGECGVAAARSAGADGLGERSAGSGHDDEL